MLFIVDHDFYLMSLNLCVFLHYHKPFSKQSRSSTFLIQPQLNLILNLYSPIQLDQMIDIMNWFFLMVSLVRFPMNMLKYHFEYFIIIKRAQHHAIA